MSTNTNEPTEPTNRLTVTDHAIWRYLERVDAEDPFPAASIREDFATADTISIIGFDLPARLSESGVIYLFDSADRVIVTIFEPTAPQRRHDISEASPSTGWESTYQAMGVDQ